MAVYKPCYILVELRTTFLKAKPGLGMVSLKPEGFYLLKMKTTRSK